MEELVSVIVPVYNAEKFLDQCLQSILGQSFGKLEVLLVDDGSTDCSPRICDGYAQRDSRVRVFHKENGGVASARNFGLARMSGAWFMTMDADDCMEPEAIARLAEAAARSGADVVIGGLKLFWGRGGPAEPERRCWGGGLWEGSLEEFTEECLVPLFDLQLIHNQNNKLYRSEIFWGKGRSAPLYCDEAMSINEDVWFSARMLARSRRVCVIPEAVLGYRQHGEQESLVSRFYENGVDTCFTLLKAVQGLLKRGKASREVRNRMENRMVFHICGFAGLCYSRSDYSDRRCLEEIRRLAGRPEFRRLLASVKPEGMKNRIAVFVLRRRMARAYHLLCLILYGRKRRAYRRRGKG